MKRFFGRFRRDVKALSPIFAVLILIAIAVIAGIIVYMFTSGYLATMMGGGTAGQEKVAIEAVDVSSTTSITAWAKSTGGGLISITEAIVKDASGNVHEVVPLATAVDLPADGTLTDVAITLSAAMNSGEVYTVALVSKAGNQFVSGSFKAP